MKRTRLSVAAAAAALLALGAAAVCRRRPGSESLAHAEDLPRRAAERDAGAVQAALRRPRPRAPGRDDPDARRRPAPHRHPDPQGREGRADPPDAHALRRRRADEPRAEHAPGFRAGRVRQRGRDHHRGRLHPGRSGRARQARLRGRLRDEPSAPRTAQPDRGRPRHRHLRHDRLAREERARVERQGRHPRHLLRRLPPADGARQSPSRPEVLRPDEPDGRRLDGRRLVPQRRLPADRRVLHLRAGGDPKERPEVVEHPLRRLRHVPRGGLGRRHRQAARDGAARLLAKDVRASRVRFVVAGRRRWTRSSRRSR